MKKSFSKKSLALLLAVAVVLTSLVTAFAVTASATVNPTNVWGGQSDVATSYAEGSGTGETANDPILISNGAELARLIKDKSTAKKYYKLTADIYLNDVTKENWKETANSWFSNPERGEARFSGNLDGDGHTIYGLYYKGSQSSMGLFILTDDYYGRVSYSNLRIAESYIETTGTYAGVIAGWEYDNGGANGGYEFNKCIIEDTVTVIAGEYAGGLVGYANAETTINACAFYGSVAANYKGGLAGQKANSSSLNITQSFVVNHWLVGSGTPTYSAIYSMVPANEIIGEAAKTRMPDLAWDEVWYTTENGYPTLTAPAAPEEPECEHETTKEVVTKEATYFKAGLKNVVCADETCGAMVETDVVIPAAEAALNGDFTETFADGKLTISWTYSDALALDILDGAKITFNYEIAGYENAVVLDGETGASVTLEGFNADRLNADLTYNLSAVYGDVDTAKLNAVGGAVKAADIANDEKLDALLEALEADAVVDGKAENTQWLVSNIAKLDLKAAKAELNVAASQELIDALAAKGGRTDRAVKLIVKIGDNFTKEIEINDLRKYTIVTISGLSFEQLNGDISVRLVFDYANDEYDFATDEIVFACGDMIANANTAATNAFAAYMSK